MSKLNVSGDDQIDIMVKQHHEAAIEAFQQFQNGLLQSLANDLSVIEKELNKQLNRILRDVSMKLKTNYISSLDSKITYFHLEPFIKKQKKDVEESVQKLKSRIYDYINQFGAEILEKNVKRTEHLSLFHTSNRISGFYSEWYSVTSRSALLKAEIHVQGFNRPTTTWLALGVTRRKKEYGLVKKSLVSEDFTGNIYLNGSDSFEGKNRVKRDLENGDVFVIENSNRMISIYRKNVGKIKNQMFILDDNTEYYFYLGFKGPLKIQFHAF